MEKRASECQQDAQELDTEHPHSRTPRTMLQPRFRPLASSIRSLLASSNFARAYASNAPSRNLSTAPALRAEESIQPSLKKDEEQLVILRTYKPRTPGVRHLKRPINDHLWKGRPHRALTFPKKGQARGGRNNTGRVTVRHRGGGHKRRIRTVDFDRRVPGPHLVERIEYDPNRTAHIALISSKADGKKSYIIAADDMRAGDVVHSYRAGIPKDLLDSMGGIIDPGILASKTAHRGNCLPMHMIPVGTMIYCIGSRRDGPARFCRSAGTYGVIASKEEETRDDGTKMVVGKHVSVRLQSGEVRKVDKDAIATIGVASNVHYNSTSLGKAGRSRWLGIRPTVRGLAMNTVDHPHGGGRGKSKGNRHPVSPWGTPAKGGYKTRRKHNINRFIVTPRVRNMGKRREK
ncbi:mitochondrial 54s ribosomal protein rml2 [Diaporthe eres]|nr:mitochondrial 54s ribosomal protein rml2 [Diaporthe eres]